MRRVMIYDIETTLLKIWSFRLGDQVVRHQALHETTLQYNIICISYMFSDSPKIHTLHWGDSGKIVNIVEQFDKIIKEEQDKGTVIIGKNNRRFDDKHVNTLRWLGNLPAMPDWTKYTEDLESQIRRHMYMPSNSLDALSKLKGFGGKNPMELSDWIKISEYKVVQQKLETIPKQYVRKICHIDHGKDLDTILKEGKAAFQKMLKYCPKDVIDTMRLFKDVYPHCEWKFNIAQSGRQWSCNKCGSTKVIFNGKRGHNPKTGLAKWQRFWCNECDSYAGRASINKHGQVGTIS